ncbi:hypothetical protein D3C76_1031570 [compost metagenome]
MRVEAVPEVLAGHRVPGPVGLLGVEEDDPRAVVLLVSVGPHVEIPGLAAGPGAPGPLEPGMLVGGVVDDQLGDHPQAAPVRLGDEAAGVGQAAVVRVDPAVHGDVVAVVAQRRGIERQQPEGVHPQLGDVVELLDQPGEVADAVVVGVEERLHVDLVDHRVLVPERIVEKGTGLVVAFRHGKLLSSGLPTPDFRTHRRAKSSGGLASGRLPEACCGAVKNLFASKLAPTGRRRPMQERACSRIPCSGPCPRPVTPCTAPAISRWRTRGWCGPRRTSRPALC